MCWTSFHIYLNVSSMSNTSGKTPLLTVTLFIVLFIYFIIFLWLHINAKSKKIM